MGTYVPDTKQEQQEMLREIGFNSFDEMFSHIPEEVKLKDGLNLMPGLSEQAVIGKMEDIAGKNVVFRHIFRGAGARTVTISSARLRNTESLGASSCLTGRYSGAQRKSIPGRKWMKPHPLSETCFTVNAGIRRCAVHETCI